MTRVVIKLWVVEQSVAELFDVVQWDVEWAVENWVDWSLLGQFMVIVTT
jgi:hypothetical protein